MKFTFYPSGDTEHALLETIARAINDDLGDDLLKVDRYDKVLQIVTDLLDETKNKEGDVFVSRHLGEDVEITLDRNALRLLDYIMDWLED